MMRTSALDDLAVNTIRMLSIDAVQRANSGHPGMPMGAADMAYTLWADFLRHDPTHPDWPDRDRFVLSAGHGAMLLYALLHLAGYDMTLEDLMSFRQWGSKAPGHPEYGAAPGIEVTTGPLGQGISTAVGMAIAERFLAATFNRPGHEIINHYTYVIASDGDLMEGISSEAASLAGHLKLGKLIVLYDDNDISIEGKTDITFTEDVGMRFRAYGWHVQHVDGFDRPAIAQAIREAQQRADAPSLIICKTILAYGSPNLQNNPEAHGAPLGKEEVILTKQNLGWPADKEFYVPEEVYALFADFRRRWTAERQAWEERFAAYAREYPKEAELLQTLWNNQLPAGWEEHLPPLRSEGKEATRNSSGVVLNAIAPYLPTLMGGSADLAPSNKTYLKGAGDFQPGSYHGRNLRFGVREHAMGAILNGLALHKGPIPYGGTFLVFSDYMRPAIRLASLMELPVVYVFTHDSIFLGEDGPTHQPIEHLAALRAIPHLVVIRPADANETVIAWKVALQRREGPTALILSRQNLPILPQTQQHCAEGLPRGAYVLSDPPTPSLDMILIATGSEVHLALGAQKALLEKGIAARVVSMPSWELFDAQPQEYRDAVLPPAVRRRLAIEAGTSQGWCKYIGEAGRTLTIDGRFGASAPAEVLAEKFGFTVDNVVRIALSMM
jgi:transketolase